MATTYYGMVQEYNLNNKVRDVSQAFQNLIQFNPTVLQLFRQGAIATNSKIEWQERTLKPQSTKIDTGGGGTGTSLTLLSVDGLKVNDILTFRTPTGGYIAEKCLITAINTGTKVVTVTRNYEGGSTPVNLADASIVNFVKTTPDGAGVSDMTAGTYTEPTFAYNYMQNVSRIVKLSKQAAASAKYGTTPQGIAGSINDLEFDALLSAMWEMTEAAIYGTPKVNSASGAGLAGGLYHFIKDGNAHDSGGGAITIDKINDVVATIRKNGSDTTQFTLACHQTQARKISALATSGTNPITQRMQNDTTVGGLVTSVISDLPNGVSNILVDNNIAEDQIFVLDPSLLEIRYLLPMESTSGNQTEADQYIARALNATYSFVIKNGQEAHGLLSGLTIA